MDQELIRTVGPYGTINVNNCHYLVPQAKPGDIVRVVDMGGCIHRIDGNSPIRLEEQGPERLRPGV
jgi:hypothetical protein